MAVIKSYNLTNAQRSVFEPFEDLRIADPNLGLIKKIKLGAKPTATKFEWPERQLSEASTTVATAPSPATSGTSIILAAAIGIELYDYLVFTSSTGQERSEVVQVTNIGAAPTYTISRSKGSTTASSIAVNDIVHVIKPQAQGKLQSEFTTTSATAPTLNYNYIQRTARKFSIANTAASTYTYGRVGGGGMAEQFEDYLIQKELEMLWEMNRNLKDGARVDNTSDTTGIGSAGGFKYFMAGGLNNTTGGAVSVDHINDAFELLDNQGAPQGTYALVGNNNQLRHVSGLNLAGTNPVVYVGQDSTNIGTPAATRFLGDLPGNIGYLVKDNTMDKDVLYLLNLDLFSIHYMEPFSVEETTQKGDKARSWLLYAEYTFRFENGLKAHAKCSGLTV